MLHLIYIFLFTIIAFLSVSNLIRNLITISAQSHKLHSRRENLSQKTTVMAHPEMLDKQGKVIDEPLLIMRSVSVEDARQQLDSIYQNSPGTPEEEA